MARLYYITVLQNVKNRNTILVIYIIDYSLALLYTIVVVWIAYAFISLLNQENA